MVISSELPQQVMYTHLRTLELAMRWKEKGRGSKIYS
jgi:hypothetical protein